MIVSKYIFEDLKDVLQEDVDKHSAVSEQKTVEKRSCAHSSVKIESGKLICQCGAVWQGASIHEMYAALKKG